MQRYARLLKASALNGVDAIDERSAARRPPRGRTSDTLATSLSQGHSTTVGVKPNPDGVAGP
eukprot:10218968-Alexandrium_andersonii.AAC.1